MMMMIMMIMIIIIPPPPAKYIHPEDGEGQIQLYQFLSQAAHYIRN
jgi:hypothetical protein